MPQVIHDTTVDGTFDGAAGAAPDVTYWRVDAAVSGQSIELDGTGGVLITDANSGAIPRLLVLDPSTGSDYDRDAGEWLCSFELESAEDRYRMQVSRRDNVAGTGNVSLVLALAFENEHEFYLNGQTSSGRVSSTIERRQTCHVRMHWASGLYRAKFWTGLVGDEPAGWGYEFDEAGVPGEGTPAFGVQRQGGTPGVWRVTRSTLVDPDGDGAAAPVAPVIAPIANQPINIANSPTVHTISATSADGPVVWSFTTAPAWASLVDNSDGTADVTYNPAPGDEGVYAVTATATNDAGTSEATWQVWVSGDNPPLFEVVHPTQGVVPVVSVEVV